MAKNDKALEVQKSGYLQLADFNMNEAMAEELDGLDGVLSGLKSLPPGAQFMRCRAKTTTNTTRSKNSQR